MLSLETVKDWVGEDVLFYDTAGGVYIYKGVDSGEFYKYNSSTGKMYSSSGSVILKPFIQTTTTTTTKESTQKKNILIIILCLIVVLIIKK